MTPFSKNARMVLVIGSLLVAMAAGSVAASSNEAGLTECDHGCRVELVRGGNAEFAIFNKTPFNASGYESTGPGQLGYTR